MKSSNEKEYCKLLREAGVPEGRAAFLAKMIAARQPTLPNIDKETLPMSNGEIKKVCKVCGSDDMLYSAFARWDVVSQEYDLWNFDPTEDRGPWCGHCEAFATTEDQPI